MVEEGWREVEVDGTGGGVDEGGKQRGGRSGAFGGDNRRGGAPATACKQSMQTNTTVRMARRQGPPTRFWVHFWVRRHVVLQRPVVRPPPHGLEVPVAQQAEQVGGVALVEGKQAAGVEHNGGVGYGGAEGGRRGRGGERGE